jgi:hypothetical protein
MLVDLGFIVDETAGEAKYFIDQYDPEDAGTVELKRLEDDYDDFVGTNDSFMEQYTQVMMAKIFNYCQNF